MNRILAFAFVLALGSTTANAKEPCRDATGKFVKCDAPTAVVTPPTGATALCKDGSYSMSKHHSGACSHHKGVAKFL